jgi:hypothetical protein
MHSRQMQAWVCSIGTHSMREALQGKIDAADICRRRVRRRLCIECLLRRLLFLVLLSERLLH